MQQKYYPEIDGLRALAVISVIIFHLDASWLPGGFSGVDIFFTISGFVVSASVSKIERLPFLQLTSEFYSRRILRILPALCFCLITTMLLSTLFIPSAWLSSNTNDIGLKAFLALSNFDLAKMDGYFSARAEFNPFTHTWSLAVEEQFYIIFPFLIYLGHKCSKRLLPIISLTLLSFILSMLYSSSYPKESFYLLHTRYWEIAAGILLFKMYDSGLIQKKIPLSWSPAIYFLGIVIVFLSFIFSKDTLFPFPGALIPVIGSLLVILGIITLSQNLRFNILKHSGLISIGKLSYSLYLWHWPIFVLFKWTIGLESLASKSMALAITIIVSYATYRLVENPIRTNIFLKASPRYAAVVFGIILLSTSYLIANTINKSKPQISQTSPSKKPELWYHMGIEAKNTNCHVKESRSELNLSYYESFQSSCVKNSRTLFALGDSHSGHFRTLYQILALHHNIDVILYRNNSQPVGDLIKPTMKKNTDVQNEAFAHLKASFKPGDLLFLSSLRIPRLTSEWKEVNKDYIERYFFSEEALDRRRNAEKELIEVLMPLSNAGLITILPAPTFVLKDITFRCVDWFNSMNPICKNHLLISKIEIEKLRKPVFESFKKIQSTISNVFIWDPLPTLCPDDFCSGLTKDRTPIIVDSDHISPVANTLLVPSFVDFIKRSKEQ